MQNIQAIINGNILTLQIDLSQTLGQTKSLKSDLIATTRGCVPIAPGRDEEFTITVYRPRKEGKHGTY